MQRILDPARIEAFSQRSIARIRLPDPGNLFCGRARRLRALSEGHALGDYLRLMAAVSDAQQAVLCESTNLPPGAGSGESIDQRMTQARSHGMPLLQTAGWPRDNQWCTVLTRICGIVAALPDTPEAARDACIRVSARPTAHLEEQGELLLAASPGAVDAEAAPFIMAALQVCWVHRVTSMDMDLVKELGGIHDEAARTNLPGVCPVCGTLPVASVVRADKQYQGYRYLHCALCATEWHLVRVKCSHCLATEGINYHFVAGGSAAVRAESCGNCGTYRKILYQEKDPSVEPVADDLASLALDLLMTEEGFRRTCCNPLLWQPLNA